MLLLYYTKEKKSIACEKIFYKKRDLQACKPLFPFSVRLFRASAVQPQNAVRDKRRNDKPNCRRRDKRIDDDRASRSRTCKHGGYEIDVEKAEKPPIQRADQDQNIRDNIDNSHIFSLLETVCVAFF